MKFIATKTKYIYLGDLVHVLAKEGEVIDLPEWIGKIHEFSYLKEGVEIKHEPEVKVDSYLEKLETIKGMGPKRVTDFIKVYPTEESIRTAVKEKQHISGRDDTVKRIVEMFSD